MRLALHTLHNTTHIMGVLSKGNHDDLHKSARHKTAESCNMHEQDNETLLDLLKTVNGNQETLALVPVWVSNHVDHRKTTSLMNTIAVPLNLCLLSFRQIIFV